MLYLDTETCGLHGMIVLLQYAEDDGEISLNCVWNQPVKETLELLEYLSSQEVCGFNLAFDWFHVNKMYNTFKLFAERYSDQEYPEDHIDTIACLEKEARDGVCLKPKKSLDLMLHARKGPYQSTMNRDPLYVRRVPTALAWELAGELNKRIPMKDIYFTRTKGDLDRWKVIDITTDLGENNPDLKTIVCRFSASTALKALAVDALGVNEENVLRFKDVECGMHPEEVGWAPFALAIGSPGNWNGAWPEMIKHHITHWGYNQLAREYAKNDIVYTRGLHKYFGPSCVASDVDSELACMVGAIRWRGLKVDIDGIKALRTEAIQRSKSAVTAPAAVKAYLKEVMDETEYLTIMESTGKVVLEEIAEWKDDADNTHRAAERAKEVLDARKATKEIEIYDKLIQAGRFHCSFKVIGTRSSRMSGTDGLNPQGINHSKKVRSKFPFAWDGLVLCGGDFSNFEVSLAAAVYKDELLNEDLKMGKKMAGLFGQMFFPDMGYDEILSSEGSEDDFYDMSKRGMYAFLYGGNEATLERRIGINIDTGKEAMEALMKRYKGIGKSRKRIEDMFCSLKQPGGLGTKVIWNEPADYVESPLGFRRYFTLENRICKELFALANDPPVNWKNYKFKVVRRDRQQTASGACQSALYGAAFQIQAANLRAAANHEIQCFGSQITKDVQKTVWDFQPCGVHRWVVMPINVHDEIDCPCIPEFAEKVKEAVLAKIETFRPIVPLIKMKWDIGLHSWKGKE